MDRFEKVADKMSYPQNLNSTFLLTKGMNSYDLKKLEKKFTGKLNNQERIENLAGRIGSQIEPIACPY
jgi:UPF0755 protein